LHAPKEKQAHLDFNLESALLQAERIGPHTVGLFQHMASQPHPLIYLRTMEGLINGILRGRFKKEALEYACEQGLIFGQCGYRYLLDAASYFASGGVLRPTGTGAPVRDLSKLHLSKGGVA
jgi:hypothetical protein